MHIAEASALTIVTGGRIRPPFSATASITSGTPWPRASRAKRWIKRAIQQSADHRDDEQEPDPEPGKVTTGDVPLLAELLVAGGQPREAKDQLAKERPRPDPRPPRPRAPSRAALASSPPATPTRPGPPGHCRPAPGLRLRFRPGSRPSRWPVGPPRPIATGPNSPAGPRRSSEAPGRAVSLRAWAEGV